MHGAGMVKNGNFRRQLALFYQVVTLEAALLTETHWADIAAPVTLNAFDKFRHPVVKALSQYQVVNAATFCDPLVPPFLLPHACPDMADCTHSYQQAPGGSQCRQE